MRLFALALALAAAPMSAHASPPPTAPALSCALLMASAQQAAGCTWIGTITLSRTLSNSTSTALPATTNNRGGTSTNALEEHDTTTLQLSGETLANVTRDHTIVTTMTTQTQPGRRCAANAPLTFGTYEMVQETRQTQRGSEQTPVQISVNAIAGTFTVSFSNPNPSVSLDTSFRESYGGLCNAPKPTSTTQNSVRPAGTSTTRSFSATFDPANPTVLDGTQVDPQGPGSGTVTWHLEGTCDCETYRRQLAEQSATLMNHSATVRALIDQLADGITAALGESPELAPAEAELGAARVQLDTLFDQSGVLGDPSDPAVQAAGQGFADAVGAWYASGGGAVVEQVLSIAPLPQTDTGLPRGLTLELSTQAPQLQSALQQLAADRQAVTATQIQLATCEASRGG